MSGERHRSERAANGVPLITALVGAHPTYGYRRIGAILNRQLRLKGLAPVNHKRVRRIMKAHDLLLARRYSERPEHGHRLRRERGDAVTSWA